MKCGVCGLESKGGPCPVCGFDQSLDWEHCPTLFPGRPELPVSQRRKRWVDTEKSALRCSGCGGIRFTVFPESGTLRCCDCGSTTTLALKKEEKTAPPPRLSYGGWNCSCGYHNSESARYCHNCSLPRPQQASGSAGGAGDGWTCICGRKN